MNRITRLTLLVAILLIAGSSYAGQISVRIGPPPAPRVLHAVPSSPGPGYAWVDGYWYPTGNHYTWHQGYWTRTPYAGARWVAPRYQGGQYYNGYWEGERGRIEHNHKWDHDKNRDNREHDH